MRKPKVPGLHQKSRADPQKRIDKFVVLVRGLRDDGMQIMTRFYETQDLSLISRRLSRLHRDLHLGAPQHVEDWRPYDDFIREHYVTTTAAKIAESLNSRHGLSVTKNMIIGRAYRLGLKKGHSYRKTEQ